MLTSVARSRFTLACLVVLGGVSSAWGSSGTFVIRAPGLDLGKAVEVIEKGEPQPPRYHVKVEVGREFLLTAQGVVLPKGGKEQPAEPDSGAWSFDAKVFKQLPPEPKQFDRTYVVVRLRATAVGTTRVRFVGRILNYERTFDVMVEVVPAKKP